MTDRPAPDSRSAPPVSPELPPPVASADQRRTGDAARQSPVSEPTAASLAPPVATTGVARPELTGSDLAPPSAAGRVVGPELAPPDEVVPVVTSNGSLPPLAPPSQGASVTAMIEPSTPPAASESDPVVEAEPTGSPLAPPSEHVLPATRESTPARPTLPPPEPYPVPPRAVVGDANPRRDGAEHGWPRSAKVTTAVLALLALVGGAAAGWFAWQNAGDDAEESTAPATAEPESAAAEAGGAIDDRNSLDAVVGELDAAADALDERVAELERRIASLEDRSDAAPSPDPTADDAAPSPDEAPGEAPPSPDDAPDDAAPSPDEAPDDAAPSPDETPDDAAPSPDEIPDEALIGDYTIDFTEIYCEGPASCGSSPDVESASIARSTEGWLELVVLDTFTVALFEENGGWFGIGDSETLIQPCDGTERVARVMVTMWPDDAAVTSDGGQPLGDLRAGISVNALDLDDCPDALALFESSLVARPADS